MKIIIKSLILAVAAINSTALLPMTLSKQPHAVVHEQEQEQQLKFYWGSQELGAVSAQFAKSVSPIFKGSLEHEFFRGNRYRIMFRKDDLIDETVIKFFVDLIKLGEQKWIESGCSQSGIHVSSASIVEFIRNNKDRIGHLLDVLTMYETSCFNQELSDVLVPMLADLRNENECPLDRGYLLAAAKLIAASSPYDHIVVQDPVLEERGNRISISSNCQLVAIIDQNFVRVVDLATRQPVTTIKHNGRVNSAAFSPDGKYVVTASWDHTAKIVEVLSGREIATIEHSDWGHSAKFSPDGKYVVTASVGKTAKIVEVPSGQVIATIEHSGLVNSAEFSSDGKYVVTASQDKTAKVVEVPSGKEIAIIRHNAHQVRTAAFGPDGKYVVTASWDKTAKIVEVLSGREIATIDHDGLVDSAEFSSDGKYVVAASWDKTAKIVEVPSGKEIATIEHSGLVWSPVFSPDGKSVVTMSNDGIVKIVEVPSGTAKATIRHNAQVRSAAFSPDGKYLVTASYGTIHVTPFGLDGMESEKVLAIAVFVHMALDARKSNQQPTVPLDENSWIFKVFMTLSVKERNRLQEQFPEIVFMVTNTVQEQALEGLAELFG